MAKTNFTEIDISSSINKLIDGTRCAFCGHKFLLSRRLKTLQDSGEKTSGLESLREVCGVGESHMGLDRRLWEGWREEEEQQIMVRSCSAVGCWEDCFACCRRRRLLPWRQQLLHQCKVSHTPPSLENC